MPLPPPSPRGDRHLGLDWLRIGAFALLILYHVAMVFAPWPWVVKWPRVVTGLIVPMALLTPWRLPLLFAVSGFATRRLLARAATPLAFVRERSRRLLLPLAFGLLVLLPPEIWVRARLAGDPQSLLSFWRHDFWRAHPGYGPGFPAWEHLWFVVYLWCYTLVLTVVVAWRGTAPVDRAASWLATRERLAWVPLGALAGAKLALLFVVPERHTLAGDWAGHAEYAPLFAFGIALGGDRLWEALHRAAGRLWPVALAAGGIAAAIECAYPGSRTPGHALMAVERAAQIAMAWSATICLLSLADRWLRRDHRWRGPLAAAVFPAYLIHHPVIVVVAWALLPLAPPVSLAAAVLLLATVGACAGFYLAARRCAWLVPFAGLPARRRGGDAALARTTATC